MAAKKTLNIEIGDQLIKVCRITKKGKGKGLEISDSFMFHTPISSVADGVIDNPQALALLLKDQLIAHGIEKTTDVCFSLSSGKIAVREVKLPPVKEKQLAAIVATNVEEYFPVDLKNYHIAHSLLEIVSGAEPYSRVLVMAVPIQMLEGYFKLADMAGLNVVSIDTAGNAEYQILKQMSTKGVTIYVDVGCTSSLITFMLEDKLLLQRTFAFGGSELIAHYIAVSGHDETEFLKALSELDTGSPQYRASEYIHTQDVEADLGRLVGSIARSVDYFNSSQWETQAERIVLMGSNRHLVGLCELVAEATGLETLYLEEIGAAKALIGDEPDNPTYIGAAGCSIAPLDLMPERFLSKSRVQHKNESIMPGVFICALLVVAAIGVSIFPILNYVSGKKALAAVQQEISELQYAEDTYYTYLAYQQGKQALDLVTAQSELPNSMLVDFFEELEAKMPESILLLSAVCTNDGVSMNVTVGSYEDTAYVLRQFRSFDSLSAVEISSISRSANEAGIERVSFSLNCSYGTNPYINGINPYSDLITPPEQTAAAQ